ncbi:MAG: hypothetical protein ACLTNK_01935 [Akkermansia muciniphila]
MNKKYVCVSPGMRLGNIMFTLAPRAHGGGECRVPRASSASLMLRSRLGGGCSFCAVRHQ